MNWDPVKNEFVLKTKKNMMKNAGEQFPLIVEQGDDLLDDGGYIDIAGEKYYLTLAGLGELYATLLKQFGHERLTHAYLSSLRSE